ncbi:hypothetical protein AU074_13910 [Pseudomonas sp. ATCC PTA-122608]|uniref:hypothetical protein n=1 Tax=Pseudomonas sp. ATCC PTA-122608 TaxID=1771311 RepID=UPI00097A6A93|nr:hypothetical protein [Pseudomonas sp. ATCC PTA-122608]OLY72266.1 hypothetical protein AU074_13910 [Pseudomonas sp. ATCC PTA-122608]
MNIRFGDFKASVKPSRDGGILEIRYRAVELDVYGVHDKASVVLPEGEGIVFRESQKVVMVFGSHAPIESGVTDVLKKGIGKVAKWRKGEMIFKSN